MRKDIFHTARGNEKELDPKVERLLALRDYLEELENLLFAGKIDEARELIAGMLRVINYSLH